MTKTELETTQTTCDNEQVGALAKLLARPGWAVRPSSWLAKLVEVVFMLHHTRTADKMSHGVLDSSTSLLWIVILASYTSSSAVIKAGPLRIDAYRL